MATTQNLNPQLLPDTNSPSDSTPTLFELYRGVLGEVQKATERAAKGAARTKGAASTNDAKLFLVNARSSLICWGCDIRVETESLESIKNTIFDSVIRSTFDDIVLLLQEYEGSGDSKDIATRGELRESIQRLESFVCPIRTSQVINSGSGPFDGMRKKITQLTNLSQRKEQRKDTHTAVIRYLKKLYFLAPSLDYPPGGLIALGGILTTPTELESSLNKDNRVEIPASSVQTFLGTGGKVRASDGKLQIWRSFLQMLKIDEDDSVNPESATLDQFKFDSMEDQYFLPDNEYVEQSLQIAEVQRYIDKTEHRKALYMISSLRIVRGARGITGVKYKSPYAVGKGSPAKGVIEGELQGGPSSASENNLPRGSSDYVYAYKLTQIRFRKDQEPTDERVLLYDVEEDDADWWNEYSECGLDEMEIANASPEEDNFGEEYMIISPRTSWNPC